MENIEFSNHPVFNSLNQINTTLELPDTKKAIELSMYEKIVTHTKYLNERLNISIPALVQKADLDNINSKLTNTINELTNFLTNQNVGHLTNVLSYLGTTLNYIKNLPIPIKGKFDFSRKIASFENSIIERNASIIERIEQISVELSNIETEISTKETKLLNLEQLISKKQLEIDNINNSFSTDYENIRSTHDSKFDQKMEEFTQDFENEKSIKLQEIETTKVDISNSTTKLVEELQNKLVDAKKLLNIIGNVGITGNYQKIANYHKDEANKWRWIALSFMVLLIGSLLYTIYHITNADFNWQVTLVRIIAFSALLYPATYASKEASKHRNLENINRKSELELASINPFIELLSDEKKQAIKEKLVDKFFGNQQTQIEKGKNKDELVSIGGVEKIIDIVGKIWNK